MKKRQILSALLAVSCASSMAVPAFAADTVTMPAVVTAEVTGAGTSELQVSASVKTPDLKVTLPTQTSVLVNPYRVEVTLEGGGTSFDTVLSPEMEVTNESACAVTVGVKGMLQTYTIVEPITAEWEDHENIIGTPEATIPENLLLGDTDGKVYSSDLKNFYDSKGRQLTVKYTPGKKNTSGEVTANAKLVVSAYTASKAIKVATSALKDEDAEKSNTLFMYVQGKQNGDSWAAFDAKKNTATAAAPAGMMALTAKETAATILYLGGAASDGTATKGQLRVTGQAATNPTQKWSEVTDDFDTKITFVVDPVANAKPAAPKANDIKIGGTSIANFDSSKYEYSVSAAQGAINVTVDSDVTPTIEYGGVISIVANTPMATANGTGTITITMEKYGMTTTYTITVEVA